MASNNNNNNNNNDDSNVKVQSEQIKRENEELKQQLERESENAKIWRLRAEQFEISQTSANNTNQAFEHDLAASRREINALTDRVRALEQELAAAKSPSGSQNKDAELELITLNAQVNNLKFENTSLKAQLRLANSSAVQGHSAQNGDNTNKKLENELNEAKSAVAQKDREISQLRGEVEEAKKRSTESYAHEKSLRDQLDSTVIEVNALKQHSTSGSNSAKEIADLKTANEVLRLELQQQSKMKRELLMEVEALQETIGNNTGPNSEVQRLQAENSQLTSQMISLQNDYQEIEVSLNKLQASHAELQASFDHYRMQQDNARNVQSNSNHAALEQELQQKRLETQQLMDEVQQWSQAAAQLQIVNEEMVRELQQEIQELKKELLELSDAYQRERDRRLKASIDLLCYLNNSYSIVFAGGGRVDSSRNKDDGN